MDNRQDMNIKLWTLDTLETGEWTLDNRQRTTNIENWTLDNVYCTMDIEQSTLDNEHEHGH